MTYQNNSKMPKTFYGVEFQPGEIREVPGFINHPRFTLIEGAQPTAPKASKPSESKPAKTPESKAQGTADGKPSNDK